MSKTEGSSRFVSIKLTPKEKEELEAFAKKIKLPVATWLKHLAFTEMSKVTNKFK